MISEQSDKPIDTKPYLDRFIPILISNYSPNLVVST